MSMNMREKIARALAEEAGAPPWEEMQSRWRACYLGNADAVLDAMREPDEGMLDAGTSALWPPLPGAGWLPGSKSVEVWQAMINAALEPPPQH